MTTTTQKPTKQHEQFAKLQIAWCQIEAKRSEYRQTVLWSRYRKFDPPQSWLTKAERAKLDSFRRQEGRVLDKMMALLDKISPRNWRSGAPVSWVMTELTYPDAITDGELHAIPPAPYGYSEKEMQVFALAA